ncbi:MAG: hypothetical protein Q8R43_02970, partial [Alphaproteobacteria bacterium]|nr:hypothetical protein [Alphaproteobacteria bacterium]
LSNNDLGKNQRGEAGYGPTDIAQALGNLMKLKYLDLSNNNIGNTGSTGTVALGKSLANLTQLTHLDLSTNEIGSNANEGQGDIVQSLGTLTQLTYLDLSHNYFPWISNQVFIGQVLGNLTKLIYIDLSDTQCIVAMSLVHSLMKLNQLKFFSFSSNFASFTDILLINQALNHTLAPPLSFQMSSLNDIETYCQSLPINVSHVNLRSSIAGICGSDDKVFLVTALMKCLSNYSQITFLDFSQNCLCKAPISCDTEECYGGKPFGDVLYKFNKLTYLNLSDNGIVGGCGVTLGQSLGNLTKLRYLDFSDNNIGDYEDDSATAIGQSIGYLTDLIHLDLSDNNLGLSGDGGIGQSLGNLTNLTFLDFSNNVIGNSKESIVAIGNSLVYLTQLKSLNFANNDISYSINVTQYLYKLTHLTYLNFSGNSLGYNNVKESTSIGHILSNLPQLIMLDLS